MPSRIKRSGGGLKGGLVVSKTARLGGLHSTGFGKVATGFEPAILNTSLWSNCWLVETGNAGSAQDATITKAADTAEPTTQAGRTNGYVYAGSDGNNGTALATVQKVAIASLTVTTLGAAATNTRYNAGSACSGDSGYIAGGIYNGAQTGNIDKFSFGTETAALNSYSFTTARDLVSGYRSGNYGCFIGGNQGSGPAYGYFNYIDFSTDTNVEQYDATLNSTYPRVDAAALSKGTSGYVAGGKDAAFAGQSTVIKSQFPGSTSFTLLSATLGTTRAGMSGASGDTKGYLMAGGWDANVDSFLFATETIGANFVSALNVAYNKFQSIVSPTTAYFCGGSFGGAYTSIQSVVFASDATAVETAVLGTGQSNGVGLDNQIYASGGAADSPLATFGPIGVTFGDSGVSATESTNATQIVSIITGAIIEGSGSGAGFFSGGVYSTGYHYGYVHRLRFDVETLELIYHDNFGQNDFAGGYGFGAVSLVNGADMYFLAGKRMVINDPNTLDWAYQYSGKVNAATLTCAALNTSFSGYDTYYGVGLSYNRFGMGFLIGNPVANSQVINKYIYSTGTGSTSVTVTPVVGNELSGYYDTGDNGYVFGGNVDSSRIARVNMSAETMTVLSATLPAGRYRSSCINSADNALVAGGQNVDGTTAYSSVSGFLGSTETSRTTTASLGVARGGTGSVSGYSKGYIGSTFIPYTYTAQAIDSIAFATETSVQTAMTLSMCGSCGASYNPVTGVGALDTPNGTGAMTTGTTETTTLGESVGAGVPFSVSRSDSLTAGTTVDGIFTMGVDGSAQAAAGATHDTTVLFVADASGQLALVDSAIVFGIDVARTEATSAGAAQDTSAVFACDAQGSASATATHPVISVLLFDGQGSASATDAPVSTRATSAIGSEGASSGDTPATIVSLGGVVTEVASATSSEVVAYSGAQAEAATAADDLSAIFGRLGTAAATATATQSATQPTINVDTVAVATATATIRGYMITSADGAAVGAASGTPAVATRLWVEGSAAASADHQQAATVAFSAVSIEQVAALDASFVTGALTAQATEALYAIVSAYAAIFGDALPPDTHFVVTKLDGQFVVSRLDQNAVLTQPAHVVVLTKDSVNVVKTSLQQIFVKREQGDAD